MGDGSVRQGRDVCIEDLEKKTVMTKQYDTRIKDLHSYTFYSFLTHSYNECYINT